MNAEASRRLDGLIARLRARGHRLTPQRVAILRELVSRTDHPCVEQLHAAILPSYPATSLATVYKTIHLLKEHGEVLELGFGELGSRYDGRHPEPHPHLICTRCGTIADPAAAGQEDAGTGFSDEVADTMAAEVAAEVAAFAAALSKRAGFAVSSHRFDLFGLCARCRAKG
ncbi:MAG: transcriptional repressor [Desulfovibrio sp.]|jgi:Fur family peroxide stress response transcriptional regulator|nr:transcriptional repressor [Desulfovibrio sp.]